MSVDPAAVSSGTAEAISVLLIEDDLVDEMATLRAIAREALPYRVQVARSVADARRVLSHQRFDVILADYKLTDGTSFDLMEDFADDLVIFITGAWDEVAAAEVLRLGVHDYLIKDDERRYLKLLHYRVKTALRQRRTERELRETSAAAEQASRAKSRFLASMSHEIRTPLNALIGINHLLVDTSLGAEQRQLLGIAETAGHSLLDIVNDVLDLAKIEAGEMELDEVLFRPGDLLREVEAMLQPQAQAKNLKLLASESPGLPDWLSGDSRRLRQVLVNLISNAIKFTAHGEVTVELAMRPMADGSAGLYCSVRDTGAGIAPEDQARLFEPFTQADASTTRRHGGTGLGLSISRGMALLMGGTVGLQSQLGEGSEFTVHVPMTLPDAEQVLRAARDSGLLEVVVADDSDIDRQVLLTQARSLGWRATGLASGQALLDLMAERLAQQQPPPDALIVDWKMPGMDGLQALATLASAVGHDRLPAALVISADEQVRLAALPYTSLVDQVLTKPINASELFNAVNDSMVRHGVDSDRVLQSTRIDSSRTRWLPGVRVLLVDDSEINLEVARRLLERTGAQVQVCSSALAALAQLRAAPTGFDAVLMDVQMPGMDGLQATRQIRQMPQQLGRPPLPIVALTAGALLDERRLALDAGMDEFLSKPLDPQELVRTLRRVVERHRDSALPILQDAPALAAARADWPQIEGIDSAEAAHRLGNDATLFLSLLARLLREFGDLTPLSPTPLPQDSAPLALRLGRLHKLRGSAAALGARQVSAYATQAEALSRAGHSEQAQAPLRELAAAMLTLKEAAAPHLAADLARDLAAQTDAAVAAATLEQLQLLEGLLRRQDTTALDRFAELAPALRAALGDAALQALARAVDDLDFARALTLLAAPRG